MSSHIDRLDSDGLPHLSAERVRKGAEGVIEEEDVADLIPVGWTYTTRETKVGPVHVFTRPVTAAEAEQVDFERYQNHRHMLGVTEGDDMELLTYVVLRHVHTEDHRALERLESDLDSRCRLTREDFKEIDLTILDNIWLPSEELCALVGMERQAVENRVARIADRFEVATRAEILVECLREGIVTPDWERWKRDDWPFFTTKQSEVLRLAHWKSPHIGEALGYSTRGVRNRIVECYKKTGTSTRAELILAALANNEFRVSELKKRVEPRPLTASQRKALEVADLPPDEIEERTGMSRSSIHQTNFKLRSRLGLENNDQLIAYAFLHGCIDNEVDDSLAEKLPEEYRQIMAVILIGNRKLMARYQVSEAAISRRIRAMQEAVGVADRRELILYGLRSGLIDLSQVRNAPGVSRPVFD